MNRRSILRLLGLAPIAAPAVMAAASQPEAPRPLTGSITLRGHTLFSRPTKAGWSAELMPDGSSRILIDRNDFYVAGGQTSA